MNALRRCLRLSLFALLPLLVMGLGVGEMMKITFLWVGGVVFLVTGTRDAVAAVP